MQDSVIDLDILAPKQKLIKLNGKTINLSFIPVGILFDIDEIIGKINKLDQEKLNSGNTLEMKKALDASISLCAIFCSLENPEMNEKWFKTKATTTQVEALATQIKDTLIEGYQGASRHSNTEKKN